MNDVRSIYEMASLKAQDWEICRKVGKGTERRSGSKRVHPPPSPEADCDANHFFDQDEDGRGHGRPRSWLAHSSVGSLGIRCVPFPKNGNSGHKM